jgi:hypothetical protein
MARSRGLGDVYKRQSLLKLKGWKTPQAGSIHLLSKH